MPHGAGWRLLACLLACATQQPVAAQSCGAGEHASGGLCVPCSPGSHQNLTGPHSVAQCTACAPGRYSPIAGLAECWTCPRGSSSPRPGASSCVLTLACNPCTDRTSKKVRAVLHGTSSDGYFLRLERAMETAAAQLKVDFKCHLQSRLSSTAFLAKIAEVLRDEQPDILIVSIPSSAVVPAIQAAAQSVHVFSVGEAVDNFAASGSKAHFGLDDENSGFDAQKAFAGSLERRGGAAANFSFCATVRVGALQGSSLRRQRGFLRACNTSGLAWLGDVEAADSAGVEAATSALLSRYNGAQGLGILVLTKSAIAGARRAVAALGSGHAVTLGVYGDTAEALEGLGQEVSFAVRENEWLQGYLSVILSVVYLTTGNLMAHQLYRTEELLTETPSADAQLAAGEGHPICDCPWAGGLESLVECGPGVSQAIGVCPNAGGGCTAPCRDGRRMKVMGVTHAHEADTFWFLVKAGAEQAARDLRLLDFEMDLFGPPSSERADAFSQPLFVKSIRDAAAKPDVDALLVSIHGTYVYGAITEAARSKAVVTINSGYDVAASLNPPGGKWLAHVGMDEFAGGLLAGDVLANAGVKHLLCLPHDQTESGAVKERMDGARQRAEARGLRVTIRNLATDYNIALDNDDEISAVIAGLLDGDPSIDGVLIMGSPMVNAMADAAERSRPAGNLIVGTFDRPQRAIELMDAGRFFIFGIDQQQYMQGYMAVIVAWVHRFTGTKLNFDVIQTGPFMVTGSELLKDTCKALPWNAPSPDRPNEAVVGDRLLPSVDVRQTEGFPVCLYSGDCSIEGLYFNSSLGSCRPCDAGTFKNSSMLGCQPCPGGSSTDGQAGSPSCTVCGHGRAAPSGAASCAFCELGSFAGESGLSACAECGPDLTTIDIASVAMDACVCRAGTYMKDGACHACKAGMTCATGSDVGNLAAQPGGADKGAHPVLVAGHWSSAEDPLYVFRCASVDRCPGGAPGSCASSLGGQACQHCPDGHYWTGSLCKECAPRAVSLLVFPGLLYAAMLPFVLLMYKFFGDTIENWGSRRNAFATILFIALVHYQKIGLINTADLPSDHEAAIDVAVGAWAWTTDLSEVFNTICSGYKDLFMNLLDKATAPLVLLVITLAVYVGSRLLACAFKRPEWKLDKDRLVDIFLSVIFTFFTSISAVSLLLFQCAPNPNGELTLVADRSVLCLKGDEWKKTLVVAIMAVLIYVVGCGGLYTWAIVIAPNHFPSANFQKRWKFLFLKYRSDVHWWSLAFLLNVFANNLTFVVLTDAPSQLLMLTTVNMIYVAAVSIFMPYRHYVTNLLEIQATLSVIWVCGGMIWYSERADQFGLGLANALRFAAWAHMALAGMVVVWMLLRECGVWHEKASAQLDEDLDVSYTMFQQLATMRTEEWVDFYNAVDDWDRRSIMAMTRVFRAEFQHSDSRTVAGRYRDVGARLQSRVSQAAKSRTTPIERLAV